MCEHIMYHFGASLVNQKIVTKFICSFHYLQKKWRMRLLEKDAEIENFRSQIDEILETLSALKPSL